MSKTPKTLSDKNGDVGELTAADLKRFKPAKEIVPHIVERHARTRGKQKTPTKVQTTIRLDADLIEHFRSKGKGWQTRLNDELRKVVNV